MSRVVVTFEDGENRGQINIRVEAADPALPIRNGDLDVDNATPAQCAARLAVGEVAGEAAAAVILTQT